MRKPSLVILALSGIGLICTALFTHCAGGSGDSGFVLPIVSATCYAANSGACTTSIHGKTAYLGINPDPPFTDCQSTLDSAANFLLFKSSFEVWSDAQVVAQASRAEAIFSDWTNENNVFTNQISLENAIACAFIDTNGNGRLDIGEPMASSSGLAMGVATESMTVWTTR